jgi:hypothetical protein
MPTRPGPVNRFQQSWLAPANVSFPVAEGIWTGIGMKNTFFPPIIRQTKRFPSELKFVGDG